MIPLPIVIYFSCGYGSNDIGNTSIVAQKIAELLRIEAAEIVPVEKYSSTYSKTLERAKKEKCEQERPKYQLISLEDVTKYSEILLGYPNWWGTYPMIIASFLEDYDLSGKTIFPFCTHAGSALGNSINDLQKISPDSTVKQGLAIWSTKISKADKSIENWTKQLFQKS